MKKRIVSIVLAIVLIASSLGIFAACDSNTSDKTVLRISEVTHSVFYAPQYVAINLGIFEKYGIEIDLINGGGADKVMTSVLSGQVDIGFAGPEAAIYVYLQGKSDYPQVFAQLTKRDGCFLVAREPDKNFKWSKLKGKHVLPGRKGGVPYMTLEYVLRNNGLDTSNDLNFDNSISFDAMTSAFLGGVGDYVTVFEPTATVIQNEGRGYIVASVGEASGEIPYTAYFANKSFLQKNPEITENFVAAIHEAQQWVLTHSSKEVAEAIAPSFSDTSVEVLTQVVERYKEIDVWNATPVMTADSFNRLQDVIEHAGELSERVDFDKIVNNSFAEKIISS